MRLREGNMYAFMDEYGKWIEAVLINTHTNNETKGFNYFIAKTDCGVSFRAYGVRSMEVHRHELKKEIEAKKRQRIAAKYKEGCAYQFSDDGKNWTTTTLLGFDFGNELGDFVNAHGNHFKHIRELKPGKVYEFSDDGKTWHKHKLNYAGKHKFYAYAYNEQICNWSYCREIDNTQIVKEAKEWHNDAYINGVPTKYKEIFTENIWDSFIAKANSIFKTFCHPNQSIIINSDGVTITTHDKFYPNEH